MWFWWFLLICDLIVPVCMVVGGRAMWKHMPAQINDFVGYRSLRSTKNADTWKFANAHCGRLWWKAGWMMLIPSALAHIPFYHGSEGTLGALGCVLCTVQCVVMFALIFQTEKALKRAFDENGNRRETAQTA